MILRFTRSLASLAILIAVYWLYALIAVPIIEPAARRTKPGPRPQDVADARSARSHERKMLESWFPPGSWELSTEMVLETPRGKLLLNQYETLPDGWLKFRPCTMVFMRDPAPGPNGGQTNAPVILQVPDGAELKFDEPPDLHHGKIGNLVEGRLVGRFTIRSDQKHPGPQDDLLIVARDAELRENRVVSAHPIEFRLGPNHGSGRDIEIDLGAGTIGAKKEEGGLQLDGIKSFAVKHDVVVMLDAGRGGLLGSKEKEQKEKGSKLSPPPFGPGSIAPAPAAAIAPAVAGAAGVPQELPLRIVCQGPFRFNMEALEASFEDKVDVLRLNTGGQSDRLQCQRLSMFFASSKAEEAQVTGEKPKSLGRLEPVRLEAYGQPVTVESPAFDDEAVGEVLRYNLKTKEVSLEGKHPVMLRRGANRIKAPKIEFKPSEESRFGSFSATGPGRMEGVAPDDPTRKFAATWKQLLSFGADGVNHVFSLRGEARAEMLGFGVLEADEIHVWVFEQKHHQAAIPGQHRAARPPQPRGGMENLPFTPQRMMAAGNVRLDALQLTGRVGEMQIWFKPAPPVISQLPNGRTVEELPPPPGAPRPTPAAIPQIGGLNSRQRFNVTGRLLQAEVMVGPLGTQLGKLRIHEQARVAETQTQLPQERPLLVTGNDIDYAQADPSQGILVVTGDTARGKQGHIEGRGLTLDGDVIRMDRGRNELTIKGPGTLTVPVDRDLAGQPAATAQSLGVRWKGGLIFDGNLAHFTESVVCDFENHELRTEQLDVSFSERVNFASTPGQKRPELGGLACHGAVTLDGRTYAKGRQASVEHMQAFDLTFDRASGAVQATGPGEMTTVRLGALAMGPLAPRQQLTGVPGQKQQVRRGPPAQTVSTQGGAGDGVSEELPSPGAGPQSADDVLTYIHVAFPREMRGTLSLSRAELRPSVVQFSERVRTTYGPVSSWDGKIDADDIDRQLAAGEAAPSSVVLMNSDLLTVTQIPAGATGKGAIELEASGTVDVEGINFQKQNFFARADKLTYTDAKDLLILQGDGRAPAELAQQAPYGTVSGRKIFFWPRENRFKVDDAQSVDFSVPAGK